MFAFSPPKSYGDSHPTGGGGDVKPGALPNKQPAVTIPTPVDTVQPETIGLPPQIPKA